MREIDPPSREGYGATAARTWHWHRARVLDLLPRKTGQCDLCQQIPDRSFVSGRLRLARAKECARASRTHTARVGLCEKFFVVSFSR